MPPEREFTRGVEFEDMLIKNFDNLPQIMKTPAVMMYYEMLAEKRAAIVCKRVFDIVMSLLLIILLSPLMLVISVMIKFDSRGPVFFRQPRITSNMKKFSIIKFRTMTDGADENGPLVTVKGDGRITGFGGKLRRSRLDEIPQIINVLTGDMSLVGTRPEVERYVKGYTDEMLATLLLPAGLTSRASIIYKDEARLLEKTDDPDSVYVNEILPRKMVFNLEYLRDFSLGEDMKILAKTLFAV